MALRPVLQSFDDRYVIVEQARRLQKRAGLEIHDHFVRMPGIHPPGTVL